MTTRYTLHTGDCLEVLRTMPDASVDAVVTDPPYGLSFMGKRWDYDVPSVEIWEECLRVLKPGGHLLAFAGTRTQHRMAVRIEDAGFEIRDMIAWVYGSGFPKSMDVSKAIDKLDGSATQLENQLRSTQWLRSTGIKARQVDEITGTQMGGHYLSNGSQPAVPTREHLELMRPFLPEVPEWLEALADNRSAESENFKNRRVIGVKVGVDCTKQSIACAIQAQGLESSTRKEYAVTEAHTDDAKLWEGWGTALKPALEPITVARKPFKGTVAANVLKYGTGALNIDGCRIGDESGRWPANFTHDGSDEVLALFPRENKGSAARFFYCAKASKKDRDEGLDALPEQRTAAMAGNLTDGQRLAGDGSPIATPVRRNIHPTVKPTDLMRYLCRLVTPPGGVILDPFMGSGSTGKAAMLEGFRFIGIEREAEYVAIAKARIEEAAQ